MKTIPLTQGRAALVDDEDYEWLSQWTWCFHRKSRRASHGYALRSEWSGGHGRSLSLHVEILKHHGLWLPGQEVDHWNGCTLDNRKENLRPATSGENSHNSRRRRNNKSGCTGIRPCKGKWLAEIAVNSKQIHLGYFRDKQNAVAARQAAEVKYFGDFRHDPFNLCPGCWSFCPDCSTRLAALLPKEPVVDWVGLCN